MNKQGATKDEIVEFMESAFPQNPVTVVSLTDRGARVRLAVDEGALRPGGTISGPTMMAVADAAIYTAIFGELGLVALAVTTQMSINFLRRPDGGLALLADCSLLKVGKKLVVGEVTVYSEGQEEPVAHAVGTYALPPRWFTEVGNARP